MFYLYSILPLPKPYSNPCLYCKSSLLHLSTPHFNLLAVSLFFYLPSPPFFPSSLPLYFPHSSLYLYLILLHVFPCTLLFFLPLSFHRQPPHPATPSWDNLSAVPWKPLDDVMQHGRRSKADISGERRELLILSRSWTKNPSHAYLHLCLCLWLALSFSTSVSLDLCILVSLSFSLALSLYLCVSLSLYHSLRHPPLFYVSVLVLFVSIYLFFGGSICYLLPK